MISKLRAWRLEKPVPDIDLDRLELEEVVEMLGGVKEVFHPHSANIVAARIVGPFCAIVGATIASYVMLKGDYSQAKLILLGMGALFTFSGVAMFVRSIRWTSYALHLCRDGLVELGSGTITVCRWDSIEKIVQYEPKDPHIITNSSKNSWTIFFGSGQRLKLNFDSTSEIGRLAEILRAVATERKIPWQLKES